MTRYRIIISAIWWVAGVTILLLFLWLTANPRTFANSDKAIDWIIPHLVPTMTLTGVVAFVQRKGDRGGRPSRQMRYAFLLTLAISIVYLCILSGAVVLSIGGTPSETEHGVLDGLYAWNKILGVFQGFAASAIGVFFVRAEDDEPDSKQPPKHKVP